MTLYSNNGINNISHNNIQGITDKDYIIQANKRINLTSLGFITFNSERLISSTEEDISFFSTTGDILLGGNGVTNNGIKINSNLNNNFVGLGKVEDAKTNLDIEINNKSLDNNVKNGLTINSNGKNLINPEIILSNQLTDSVLSMGVGLDENELNLKIVASKLIINSKIYLKSLNNFTFNVKDIGNKIKWADNSFSTNTILDLLETSEHGILALINYHEENISNFSYQIGQINRNDFGYLRTKKANDLFLGTNNKNILNITNSGDVGINTQNPNASFHIKNNYGCLFNNKLDKEKVYSNSNSIQFKNGTILVLSQSKKLLNYSLEGFFYNQNGEIINNITIVDKSKDEIIYSIDTLEDINDLCIIAYCYKKENSLKQNCYFTETNIFKNNGKIFSNTLKNIIQHDVNMNQNSFPNVKSFNFINQISLKGYLVSYNELGEQDKMYGMIQIFKNHLPGNVLNQPFNSTIDLYTNNVKLNKSIVPSLIMEITSGYIGLEIDDLNNDIIVTYSNKITDSSAVINYHSFIQRFTVSQHNQLYTITRNNFGDNLFLDINVNDKKNNKIIGTRIKLIEREEDYRNYNCIFYTKNIDGFKTGFYSKKIKIKNDTYSIINKKENDINESINNNLLIDIPTLDLISNNNYIISWTNGNKLLYRNDNEIEGNIQQIITKQPNQVFAKCIKDLKGSYKETLIMWNNLDNNDLLNYNSITMKNILSTFNLLKINNENSKFNIKNTGEFNLISNEKININNSLEVNKKNVVVKSNLVLSHQNIELNEGTNGQLNYFNNKLFIYLNNKWNEINLL